MRDGHLRGTERPTQRMLAEFLALGSEPADNVPRVSIELLMYVDAATLFRQEEAVVVREWGRVPFIAGGLPQFLQSSATDVSYPVVSRVYRVCRERGSIYERSIRVATRSAANGRAATSAYLEHRATSAAGATHPTSDDRRLAIVERTEEGGASRRLGSRRAPRDWLFLAAAAANKWADQAANCGSQLYPSTDRVTGDHGGLVGAADTKWSVFDPNPAIDGWRNSDGCRVHQLA